VRDLPPDADTNPIVIDGHSIPPGTRIGVNIYALHHNKDCFPEPFVFKPERWLPEESQLSPEQTKIMHYAFSPFSIGPRSCAGKSMAYLEVSLVLAKTLWYFDFERPNSGLAEGTDLLFQTEDQFGSRHTGPQLKFRPRGDMWKELFLGTDESGN
jgi:cytochrome P450